MGIAAVVAKSCLDAMVVDKSCPAAIVDRFCLDRIVGIPEARFGVADMEFAICGSPRRAR